MGGQVSKAKRACISEKSSDFSGSLTGSVGASINKKYDTECVQNMLSN